MFVIKQRTVCKTLGDRQPPSPAHTMYAAAAWTTRTPPSIHCPMEDCMPSASLGHHYLGCTPTMFLPWDLCTHSSHCWEHASSNTHTACSPDRKKRPLRSFWLLWLPRDVLTSAWHFWVPLVPDRQSGCCSWRGPRHPIRWLQTWLITRATPENLCVPFS